MQVKLSDRTNFNGIYKLTYSKANCESMKSIVSDYMKKKEKPILIFNGSNPLVEKINKQLNQHIEALGYSNEWFENNAFIHHVDIYELKRNPIYVFTTEESIKKLHNYYQKQMKLKNSLYTKIKRFFIPKKKYPEDLPKHLRLAFDLLKYNKKENEIFQKFIEKEDVKNFNHSIDLYFALMKEK